LKRPCGQTRNKKIRSLHNLFFNTEYTDNYKGISKNLPYPLLWRGIIGEVKKIKIFRDAHKL
jgi:hypothetical protein